MLRVRLVGVNVLQVSLHKKNLIGNCCTASVQAPNNYSFSHFIYHSICTALIRKVYQPVSLRVLSCQNAEKLLNKKGL